MNKGFAHYFRRALGISAGTVWKNKNVIKSMWYFFISLVARLTLFLGAMVSLADVRQARIAKAQRTVDIPQSLTKASQRSLWTMIVARVLELLIFLGGILLLSLVCGLIFSIGLLIAQFVGEDYITLVYAIFAVPCLIIYLVYTIIMVVMFAPTAYVIDANPNLSAGDAVSVCISSMKNRGKLTVFLCVIVPSLIMLAILGVCVGAFVLVALYAGGEKFTLLLYILCGVLSVFVLGFFVPVFNLGKNLSLVLLFEDIALDPVNAGKKTSGINIKRITGAKIDREEAPDNLEVLFSDEIEERIVESESLKTKKRKKKGKGGQPAPVAKKTEEAPEVEFEEIDDYPEEAPKAQSAPQEEAQTTETAAESPAPAESGESAEAEDSASGGEPDEQFYADGEGE